MPDIHATLDERGKRYGDFTDHSDISETLLGVVMFPIVALPGFASPPRDSWTRMEGFQRQALRTICDKLARIANGDPHYDDNWRDIAGYATLVLDRLGPPEAKTIAVDVDAEVRRRFAKGSE